MLGLRDFPPRAWADVDQAMQEGADMYGCDACGKRWCVLRQRLVKNSDGVVSLEPVRTGSNTQLARLVAPVEREGQVWNRKQRRRAMAGSLGEPLVDLPLIASDQSPEERRKARNARKAERQRGRR